MHVVLTSAFAILFQVGLYALVELDLGVGRLCLQISDFFIRQIRGRVFVQSPEKSHAGTGETGEDAVGDRHGETQVSAKPTCQSTCFLTHVFEFRPRGFPFHRPPTGVGSLFTVDDEAGEMFSNSYLSDMKSGKCNPFDDSSSRLSEMARR